MNIIFDESMYSPEEITMYNKYKPLVRDIIESNVCKHGKDTIDPGCLCTYKIKNRRNYYNFKNTVLIDKIIKNNNLDTKNCQKSDIDEINNILLYRFADAGEYITYKTNPIIEVNLKDIFDLIPEKLLEKFPRGSKIINYKFKIRKAVFSFKQTRNNITIEQYLSRDKGVGGQIIGWQFMEKEELYNKSGGLQLALNNFNIDENRSLIVVINPKYKKYDITSHLIATGYDYEYIDVPSKDVTLGYLLSDSENSEYFPPDNSHLIEFNEKIKYVDDKIKAFKGGLLMGNSGNDYEIDYVVNGLMKAYKIEVSVADKNGNDIVVHDPIAYSILMCVLLNRKLFK
jgi:hypothetical protein